MNEFFNHVPKDLNKKAIEWFKNHQGVRYNGIQISETSYKDFHGFSIIFPQKLKNLPTL